MTIEKMYEYLGTNGILLTPIHLEGIYCIKKLRITASEDKMLTKDNKKFMKTTIIPIDDLDLWYEV